MPQSDLKLKFTHSGSGPRVLLLLHGWSGSSASLAPLAGELVRRGYQVYNLDLPGFGGTEPPPRAYTLKDYTIAISDFITEHKLVRPVLVGHSFGGKISLKLAAEKPQLISGVVAIDTSGIKPDNDSRKRFLGHIARIGKKVAGLPLLGLFAEPARKVFYKLVVREQDYYRSGALKETFVNIVNEHLDSVIPAITVPLLLIWGAADKATPLWMGQRIKQLVKGSQLVTVPEAGHNLPKVQPAKVAEIIYNNLK